MIDFSIEFFPPKTPNHESALWECLNSIKDFNPEFISVTYGADGSTRDRTHSIVQNIHENNKITCVPHLTCVNTSKDEISEILDSYSNMGVKSIVALRGDKPTTPNLNTSDYAFAYELVTDIKLKNKFQNIYVAAYPEKHPEAKSLTADLNNLKRKIDCGATAAITQFFFNNNYYYDFLNKCEQMGIGIPIIPGILPINNFTRVSAFASKCGASIPKEITKKYESLTMESECFEPSLDLLINQVNNLIENQIKKIHFYTLNQHKLLVNLFSSIE